MLTDEMKEIALRVAKELPLDKRFSVEQICVEFAERFLAALPKPEPTSVTCQIYGHVVGACGECNTHTEADDRVAEACAKAAVAAWHQDTCHLFDIEEAIKHKWREFL